MILFSILFLSFLQISIGYFLADVAMILWHFPALGGLEYVSNECWFLHIELGLQVFFLEGGKLT